MILLDTRSIFATHRSPGSRYSAARRSQPEISALSRTSARHWSILGNPGWDESDRRGDNTDADDLLTVRDVCADWLAASAERIALAILRNDLAEISNGEESP